MSRPILTRRELVASATVAGAFAAVPPAWGRQLLSKRARIGPGAFLDGVASGEPGADAVTFWSRLTTARPRSGARLVVATDPGMRRVVATTVVPTGDGVDGALKARVGKLKPATEYFYAWESGTNVSPIGRTRTAVPPGSTQPLRLGFSSCQHYAFGHFGAHAHAAAQPLDLYLFLGDYVYEDSRAAVRADPIIATDLGTYRRKYALYRADPGLRELHRLHPVIHTWDDHEVENNYSDNNPPPAPAQRTAGYRAAFEWMPRLSLPPERHRVYRQISYGALADIFVLDSRQYRNAGGAGSPRNLLGDAQMGWLIDGLKRSTATWKVIAQQVLVAQMPQHANGNSDSWSGYPDDRRRLLSEIERAGINNVVFLTGDAHVFMTSLLGSDFEAMGDGSGRKPAAVEYVGGSVTSPGRDLDEEPLRQAAPWIKHYDGFEHGYARLVLNPDQLVTDYLSSDVTVPAGGTQAFQRFVQLSGQNTVQRSAVGVRSARGRA